jgi:hypothetical protein
MDAKQEGFGAKNDADGYAIFDLENEWIKYLVALPVEGFLLYDVNGAWSGLIV